MRDGADEETVAYRLEQEFHYSYESSVRNIHQRLVVMPRQQHGGQRRRSFSFATTGGEAVSSLAQDEFGNDVMTVTVDAVDAFVVFRSTADVDVWGTAGHSLVDPTALRDLRYLAPTALTRCDRRLSHVASGLARKASGEALARLICSWTHAAMDYGFGTTTVHTTASEAASGGQGVCQDFAHIMLALCRSVGLPARYVSGHLVGEGGSHAWVEVLVTDQRGSSALAFDPTHDRHTTERYLTVAIGRDYADVAPTSGTFDGACSSILTAKKHLFSREGQELLTPVPG